MGLFSKIIFKILKENSLEVVRKNKNSKIGNAFRIGNYSHFSIHPSASLLINNRVNLRNYCNFVLGENATVILEENVFMNNYCSIIRRFS